VRLPSYTSTEGGLLGENLTKKNVTTNKKQRINPPSSESHNSKYEVKDYIKLPESPFQIMNANTGPAGNIQDKVYFSSPALVKRRNTGKAINMLLSWTATR